MATRCDGGGSTTLTSSVARVPERQPALPPDRGGRAELRAERVDGARVGSADGRRSPRRDAHDEGAQGRAQAADGPDRRVARAEDADHLRLAAGGSRKTMAPPTSALMDRLGDQRVVAVDVVDDEAEGRARPAAHALVGRRAARGREGEVRDGVDARARGR